MVDFTNCQVKPYKIYGGANGGKICIIYNYMDYMLKFSSIKKGEISRYSNSCISEYISWRIIETLGLNVQETILGYYTKNYASKVVVALLGNFDIHNGNWGFLINEETEEIIIAPIFDYASCLYPQLTDEDIENIINNQEDFEARVFIFPNSALKINDNKINYFNYISSLENENLNKVPLKIFPKINLDKINKIIDGVEVISDIRKMFYKKIIKMRYEKILKFSYDKLINRQE